MQVFRTFIAVELSEAVRQCAARLIEQLASSQADVKWVQPENMHLTLKFLGDVPAVQTPQVCQAVSEAVSGVEPFHVTFRAAGAFPDLNRPHTVWLGVEQDAAELEQLAERIERALGRLGFPPESRRFHPHLTLGRLRRGGRGERQLGALLRQLEPGDPVGCRVEEVVVFASFLDRSGPTYQVLGRSRLKGAGV